MMMSTPARTTVYSPEGLFVPTYWFCVDLIQRFVKPGDDATRKRKYCGKNFGERKKWNTQLIMEKNRSIYLSFEWHFMQINLWFLFACVWPGRWLFTFLATLIDRIVMFQFAHCTRCAGVPWICFIDFYYIYSILMFRIEILNMYNLYSTSTYGTCVY